MLTTVVKYKAVCDKCGCVLNDIHLNNEFVNVVQLIDYARNGGWIVNKKECLCDMCREPRKKSD